MIVSWEIPSSLTAVAEIARTGSLSAPLLTLGRPVEHRRCFAEPVCLMRLADLAALRRGLWKCAGMREFTANVHAG